MNRKNFLTRCAGLVALLALAPQKLFSASVINPCKELPEPTCGMCGEPFGKHTTFQLYHADRGAIGPVRRICPRELKPLGVFPCDEGGIEAKEYWYTSGRPNGYTRGHSSL